MFSLHRVGLDLTIFTRVDLRKSILSSKQLLLIEKMKISFESYRVQLVARDAGSIVCGSLNYDDTML